MLRDFKTFLLRGNVVDLAVAVVVGAALLAVVQALVADIFTPLIAAIFGQPDFSALDFTINKSRFTYGHLINAVIAFVIIASVVFFFIVTPVNALIERSRREPTPDPTTRKCPECMGDIPIGARRCMHCTSPVV